jgi:bifunctional enzyme CysN/CysC
MARTKKNSTVSSITKSLNVQEWIGLQAKQDLLRFITCGSVDDGKSTLIGRLLWESQQIFDDQLSSLRADSVRHGTQGDNIDFALLVDGLAAEREQGITIDVAYRFFSTARRKFIVADTPGHEQYTRNMITGASTAQVAVVLIDATQGILTQTRRHAYLASLIGIKDIVLAINKMDLVSYQKNVFESIQHEFSSIASRLNFNSVTAIPLSALRGDNLISPSVKTSWYLGPTLLNCLEEIHIQQPSNSKTIFPVQLVNRPDANFRGLSGMLSSNKLSVGDELRVTSSGQIAILTNMISTDGPVKEAQAGDSLTLILDRDIDASRGDVISLAKEPLEQTDQFEATLIWMHEDLGYVGRTYELKLANQWASATITKLKNRINVNTQENEPCTQLALNDIAIANLSLTKSIVYESYLENKTFGGFVLVDKYTHATVAAGMIRHTLRRSKNIHQQALSIQRNHRERLNGHPAKVIWFTGLSGSGKSTIANALEKELYAQGNRTYILDGDNIRKGLNNDLGFTDADRIENIRRIAEMANLMKDAGLIVIVAFISPFKREREMAKNLIGSESFVEVYLNTPLEICEQRDAKGLYQLARSGKIPNFTGINSPFEKPDSADIEIDTSNENLNVIVKRILTILNS